MGNEGTKVEAPSNPIREKALAFAARIVQMCRLLRRRRVEEALLSQVLRSGTSIVANVAEAQGAVSRADFRCKMQIAYKEVLETEIWLDLLVRVNSLSAAEFASIREDCSEVARLLTAITRRAALPASNDDL